MGIPAVSPHRLTQPMDHSPEPQPKPRDKPFWTRRLLLTLLAGFTLLAAGLVIYIQTDQGRLIIQSPDPNLQVRIKQADRTVKDWELQKGDNRTTLRSGKYEIQLLGKTDGLRVKNDTFTLTRGGEQVATIQRQTQKKTPDTAMGMGEKAMGGEGMYGSGGATMGRSAENMMPGWGGATMDQARSTPQHEKQRLVGTWKVVEAYDGGKPNEKAFEVVITEDLIASKTREGEGKTETRVNKYTIDPTTTPKEITIKSESSKTYPGIYALEGNRLRICTNNVIDSKRPKSFTSVRRSNDFNTSLLVLEKTSSQAVIDVPWKGDKTAPKIEAEPPTAKPSAATPQPTDRNKLSQLDSKYAWQPLQVKLVDSDGHPVQGSVDIIGETFAGGKLSLSEATTDEGRAKLGQIPAGEYSLKVHLEALSTSTQQTIVVGPGRPQEYKIVCPTSPPPMVPVDLQIEPPKDLADLDLYYIADIKFTQREFAGRTWKTGSQYDTTLLVGPDSRIWGTVDKSNVMTTSDEAPFITTTYSNKIQPKLLEKGITTFPGFDGVFTLVPYAPLSEPAEKQEFSLLTKLAIPVLKKMSLTDWLRRGFKVSDKNKITISVDAEDEERQFWKAIRDRKDILGKLRDRRRILGTWKVVEAHDGQQGKQNVEHAPPPSKSPKSKFSISP